MRRHADVVLLVRRGGSAVDGRRVGQVLVLAGKRRGRDLRQHEAGVEARLRRQEGRQLAQRGIGEQRDPAFRERADLGQRERDLIGGERHRLAMEIAARKDRAGFAGCRGGEHQRIVRDAVRLAPEHQGGAVQQLQAGAHDLRLAAQAVGVLHALALDQVRSADRAAGEQSQQSFGNPDLGGLAAHRIEARIEGHIAAERRIHTHGAGDQGGIEHGLRAEQAEERQRGRDLRTVQERQALLGPERQGLLADAGERRGRGHHRPVKAHLADADQAASEMGKRRQITRGADRTLGRNHWQRVMIDEREQELDGAPPDAGMTEREARRLQREDQTDHGIWQRRAEAAHVRQHEAPLQLLDLVRRDAHRRELAEPGIDAVDGRAAPCRPFDHRRRRLDRRPAGVVENHLMRSCSERTELLEAERPGGEPDGVSHGGRLSGRRGTD